jgi:hypothetical protein
LSKSATDWSKKDAAVVSSSGKQIGTLRSEAPSPGTYKARMFWQAQGEYGPWVDADAKLEVERCVLA